MQTLYTRLYCEDLEIQEIFKLPRGAQDVGRMQCGLPTVRGWDSKVSKTRLGASSKAKSEFNFVQLRVNLGCSSIMLQPIDSCKSKKPDCSTNNGRRQGARKQRELSTKISNAVSGLAQRPYVHRRLRQPCYSETTSPPPSSQLTRRKSACPHVYLRIGPKRLPPAVWSTPKDLKGALNKSIGAVDFQLFVHV